MPTERKPDQVDGREPSPGDQDKAGVKAKIVNFRKTSRDEQEKKKQLQDYTAWVNNYLKRRPGVQLVTDLRASLQDGTTFVLLVEILRKIEIENIERSPTTTAARKINTERACDFLRSDGVNLHNEAAKDLLDGNVKGIMKVILAVAERYQPRSVKPRGPTNGSPGGPTNNGTPGIPTIGSNSPMNGLSGPQSASQTVHSSGSSGPANGPPASGGSPYGSPMGPGVGPSMPAISISTADMRLVPHDWDNTPTLRCMSPEGQPRPLQSSVGASPLVGANSSLGAPHSANRGGLLLPPTLGPPQQQQQLHPPQGVMLAGYQPPKLSYAMLSQPDPSFGERHLEPIRSYSLSQADADSADQVYSTPVDQLPPTAAPQIISKDTRGASVSILKKRNRTSITSFRSIPEGEAVNVSTAMAAGVVYEDFQRELGGMLKGLTEFKSELMQLHAVLLQNSNGSETPAPQGRAEGEGVEQRKDGVQLEVIPPPVQPGSAPLLPQDAKRTPYRQQSTQVGKLVEDPEGMGELQRQYHQLQDEFSQLEAECATLRTMVEERNTFIKTMKSEIYRKEYRNDTERVDMRNQLLQRDALIKKMEGELAAGRVAQGNHQEDLERVRQQLVEKEELEEELRGEVERLSGEVARLSSSTEESRGAGREKKSSHPSEEKGQEGRSRWAELVAEDVESIKENLLLLRAGFAHHDPQLQTVDVLDRNMADLSTRLLERGVSPTTNKKGKKYREGEEKEKRKKHRERHYMEIREGSAPLSDATKVVYYLLNDKTETPYVTSVPRRIDSVRLKDFKAILDRHSNYRFYIKTADPDCGVVKEEITDDDYILPSWNGKVLIYVREMAHHR